MHIHILGICGTFMGGVAMIARELGFVVTGSDESVYPPMSTQLESLGIELFDGYSSEQFKTKPDLVVIGNALGRGNECVEYVLDHKLPYTSGPEFIAKYILQDKWVLGIAGTHGKTTTTSMLSWILEYAGFSPGFLVGGIPENFGVSARIGDSSFFVIEADEYDTAFFDKRSKFVHYKPNTLIINNLEFDHADIFEDLDAIKKQFHHLVRTVPSTGLIIYPQEENNIDDVISMGVWTPLQKTSIEHDSDWKAILNKPDGSEFTIVSNGNVVGTVSWELIGLHNVSNALAATAAAKHVGILPTQALAALSEFKSVKRRMELKGTVKGVSVYDDFAHHPTAIKLTLQGLRQKVGDAKIFAVLEPRSNTMKLGIHKNELANSLVDADHVLMFKPENLHWDAESVIQRLNGKVFESVTSIISHLKTEVTAGDYVLIMSNGGFENIHQRLLDEL